LQGIDLYVATDRQQHGESQDVPVDGGSQGSSVLQQMQDKLKTEAGKAVYKMRNKSSNLFLVTSKRGEDFAGSASAA